MLGKLAGFVSALNVIPFIDPTIGAIVFSASILKDAVIVDTRAAGLRDGNVGARGIQTCWLTLSEKPEVS